MEIINSRSKIKDLLILLALLLAVAGYFNRFFNFASYPAEDAAMIMRYAEHFSQGFGITWNAGEDPVEGSTDFLSTVVMGSLIRLGLSAESSSRMMGFGSHFITLALVFWALRRFHRCPMGVAIFTTFYLALGPGVAYIQSYFSTPFFALFVSLSWFFAWGIVRLPSSLLRKFAFTIFAFLMALTRPEGLFMAVFMLTAIVYYLGWGRDSKTLLVVFIPIFFVAGAAYFVWRLRYFGHLLPNPFYVKSQEGFMNAVSLKLALYNLSQLGGPFLFAPLIALHCKNSAKRTVFFMLPIVGFILLWALLSDSMNFVMRYHYAVLPVLLMSWPAALPENFCQTGAKGNRHAVLLIGLLAFAGSAVIFWQHTNYRFAGTSLDGRYELAKKLSEYKDKNYTMLVTEAGLLPFYSKWRAIDAWGLNDEWIAHHKGITEDYLTVQAPHLIMAHAYGGAEKGRSENQQDQWSVMTQTLTEYAQKHGYILAAAFGADPSDLHLYYVRPDFPDSHKIIKEKRDTRYLWYQTGKAAVNHAPPLKP